MKWASIKWAVIATIGWAGLLVAVNCAGAFMLLSQALPDVETQARSYRMGYLSSQALIVGWIAIWLVWLA